MGEINLKSACYKAIGTKYIPPSNTKSSRVKAYAEGGHSVTFAWSHDLNADGNHTKAAQALAEKMGWRGRYFRGGMPNGTGFVYVHIGDNRYDHEPCFVVERE